MAKAIVSLSSGLKAGYGYLGLFGGKRGTVKQQVHDGDTIIIEAAGNLSVRFLGVDTPEVSYTLPGRSSFDEIDGAGWEQFLADPFKNAPLAFVESLGKNLRAHLEAAAGPGCAANHALYAEKAQRHLESLVDADIDILGQDKDTFQFFFAFATEVMDGYGRLLCFVNRNQEIESVEFPRPVSYNERLLIAGMACPYFIWPNVNPFRRAKSLAEAVPTPGDINEISNSKSGLGTARKWVRQAREHQIGIFDAANPLKLLPFELRFLSRQAAPNRWVIDLSDPTTRKLVKPVNYYQIPNIEDRLFIPEEYIPLFREKGWRLRN